MLGDAPGDEREAFRDLGWSLGMAFQITDDILDISGLVAETGKPVGTDLRAGLVTLPVILYLGDRSRATTIACAPCSSGKADR